MWHYTSVTALYFCSYYTTTLSTKQELIWIIFRREVVPLLPRASRIQVIDPYKMYGISAEFGSLPTHLQPEDMGPGSRNLKLQIWQICWSFGSFALTGNAARAPVLHARSAALGPILFIKNGVWEFQKVEVLEPSFVQPGH